MRIVTWNCKMRFNAKADALLALNPDIAVIPECSQQSMADFRRQGYKTLWFGAKPNQGLGVLCRHDWDIRVMQDPDRHWIVPIEVMCPTPFTLIAVWACTMGSSKQHRYIGLIHQSLIAHPEWFKRREVVIAGDLNSNKIWDAERPNGNHSAVVKLLADRGLVSGYHSQFSESHGEEKQPTFYLYHHQHRPYHLDYIFFPDTWLSRLKSVTVGDHATWSKLSDHCPVLVEIQGQGARKTQ